MRAFNHFMAQITAQLRPSTTDNFMALEQSSCSRQYTVQQKQERATATSHAAILWERSRACVLAQSVKKPEVSNSHLPHAFLPRCHHDFLHHVSSSTTCCQAPLPVFQGFVRGLSYCSIRHMRVHFWHSNLNHMIHENAQVLDRQKERNIVSFFLKSIFLEAARFDDKLINGCDW